MTNLPNWLKRTQRTKKELQGEDFLHQTHLIVDLVRGENMKENEPKNIDDVDSFIDLIDRSGLKYLSIGSMKFSSELDKWADEVRRGSVGKA